MIIKDTVVHDVDTVRWLLGHELVRATVLTPRPTSKAPDGVHDPQVVLFQTNEGALVHVEAFVNAQYGYDIRCEIVGEAGAVALAPTTEVPTGFQERFGPAYINELGAWVASIADGDPVGASAWDGYAAAAACEAAWESLTTGLPVDVRLEAPQALQPSTKD